MSTVTQTLGRVLLMSTLQLCDMNVTWNNLICCCRARVHERTVRYGLGQHQYLGRQFDGDSIFGSEGKAVMATKYKQWRIMAVVFTRWQMYTVHPATCLDEQLQFADILM